MVTKCAVLGMIMLVSGAAVAQDPPTLLHPTVHFQSDSTELVSEDRAKLSVDMTWLQNNPAAVVILEGHCDQTGGADYNMELGDRRAREIKSLMIQEGIAASRIITVVSFGETQPAVAGATHAALQQNRRVELILQ